MEFVTASNWGNSPRRTRCWRVALRGKIIPYVYVIHLGFGSVRFKFSSLAENFHRSLMPDKVERPARIRACADERYSLWKW